MCIEQSGENGSRPGSNVREEVADKENANLEQEEMIPELHLKSQR
jgi:hypothetical protein